MPLQHLLSWPPGQRLSKTVPLHLSGLPQYPDCALHFWDGSEEQVLLMVEFLGQHLMAFGWEGHRPWRASPLQAQTSAQTPSTEAHSSSWNGIPTQHLLSWSPGQRLSSTLPIQFLGFPQYPDWALHFSAGSVEHVSACLFLKPYCNHEIFWNDKLDRKPD